MYVFASTPWSRSSASFWLPVSRKALRSSAEPRSDTNASNSASRVVATLLPGEVNTYTYKTTQDRERLPGSPEIFIRI
jgi:hypothetical protein